MDMPVEFEKGEPCLAAPKPFTGWRELISEIQSRGTGRMGGGIFS